MTPHAEVRLASDVDAIEPGKSFRLGLHFKMAKGWHIYWSNPGVAGEPPQIDLTLPEGVKASPIIWPTPVRAREDLAMTYSYFDEALLPFDVTAPAGHSSLPIKAKASWLICEKICVPESGELSLTLPSGTPTPSREAPLFAAAAARTPVVSPYKATATADGLLTVNGDGLSPQSVKDAWFLPAAWGAIDDLAPQPLTVTPGRLTLALKTGETFNPKDGLSGVLVLKDSAGNERYLTVNAPLQGGASAVSAPKTVSTPNGVSAAPKPVAATPADPGIFLTLAFAFIGGLILNLMPCVFPILAMKAMGVARLSGHEHGVVKAHAGSYTLGVLTAFGALAGLLLMLRAGGIAAGWGFQFQSPIFVAATAWLLFAIGLNLSGVFEIGGGFTGAGDDLTKRGGHAGSFFTGLLAVLVATPCTAPFMATAMAVAATAAPATTLLIFLTMGIGLAAPYGLLAIIPGAARLLPRPGRWMLIFRQALAFPMYAAAVWLAWVVAQEAGTDGLLLALSGAVLIGFAAWLFQTTRDSPGRGRAVGLAGAVAASIAALALLTNVAAAPQSTSGLVSADEIPYSPSRLAELRAEGRPVFIDMTAAWCVTCLINERVALSTEAVRQAFAKRNIAYLKGDWTRADPAITRFLRDHKRDGVPLYVFYPKNGSAPVVLPQILTESIVLNEIDRFGS